MLPFARPSARPARPTTSRSRSQVPATQSPTPSSVTSRASTSTPRTASPSPRPGPPRTCSRLRSSSRTRLQRVSTQTACEPTSANSLTHCSPYLSRSQARHPGQPVPGHPGQVGSGPGHLQAALVAHPCLARRLQGPHFHRRCCELAREHTKNQRDQMLTRSRPYRSSAVTASCSAPSRLTRCRRAQSPATPSLPATPRRRTPSRSTAWPT